MAVSHTEHAAVVAEAIHRSIGVRVGDVHLAAAIAMMEEAEGHRPRRARRAIKRFRASLPTEQDRSLAAAIPTFRFALSGDRTHVIVVDDPAAWKVYRLYMKIGVELGLSGGIGLTALISAESGGIGLISRTDRRDAMRAGPYEYPVTVGAVEQFQIDQSNIDPDEWDMAEVLAQTGSVAIFLGVARRRVVTRWYQGTTGI